MTENATDQGAGCKTGNHEDGQFLFTGIEPYLNKEPAQPDNQNRDCKFDPVIPFVAGNRAGGSLPQFDQNVLKKM